MEARVGSFDQLLHRVCELERRVSRLEPPAESPDPDRTRTELSQTESQQAEPQATSSDGGRAWGVFGSLAISLLGLAGAFLLRAAADSGWLPHSAGIAAAFAYALMWIVAAGKTKNRDESASTIYVLASSIIFISLVWEHTVYQALLPPTVSALLLVAYLCTGQLVAWVHDRREIAAVTVASTVVLSLVLFVATRDLMPFNLGLLCTAATYEFAASRGRWLGQRWVAALGADLAILITAWIFSQPATLREAYVPYGPSSVLAIELVLVLVYLASVVYRTLAVQTVVTAFEAVQTFAALGVLILGQIVMAPAGRQRLVGGIVCFLIAKGSYVASILLARKGRDRNSLLYGILGVTSQIAAILMVVPPEARLFAWSMLGAGAAWLGRRERLMSLQLQAPVYLFAAAAASGLVQISVQSLSNVIVPPAVHAIAILISTADAVVAYRLAGSDTEGKARLSQLLCGALLMLDVLGVGAVAIKGVLGTLLFATSLRVALICLAAIVSARWGMSSRSPTVRGWVWLSYSLMLYGACRIVVDDLLSGPPASTALSLLFYGGALLLVTRTLRERRLT